MAVALNIKMTGSSGYLGNLISKELTYAGHSVSGIERKLLYGQHDLLVQELTGSDVVINLAGAPILQRWTKKNKKTIYDSRVVTTTNLIKALNSIPEKERPKKIISASAIGIYKNGEHHDETSSRLDSGFVGKVVTDWEKGLDDLPENVQKVVFRTGLVLGRKSKTIQNLLLPFKLGLGATVGNGQQAFPFIHEKDVSRAFLWAVEQFSESAKFNLAAPENISNKQFTEAFARALKRPVFLFIPEIILKILYGKAAGLISKSPSVSTAKIVDAGFEFEYPDINSALSEIISK